MSTTKRLLSVALAVLFTAGWGGCGQAVKPPKVVYVEVEKQAKIPDEFLKNCEIAEPTNSSIRELLDVAAARKLSLQKCNEDKAGLRKINESAGK